MTIPEIVRELDSCGAAAVGILQCMDEHGHIPEALRDQVLDVLKRWQAAASEWKRNAD